MTDHDLEVSGIVDLDIGSCRCTRGPEDDRATWADVAKEATPIPGCLPLGSHRE